MAKALIDFNREYGYKCYLEEREILKAPPKGSLIKNMIFYSFLIVVVAFAFFWSNNNEAGRRFGKFSYHTVLTSSMQSVYPQGSLVTSWGIKPGELLHEGLTGGDDIVFVTESGKVIVHRIVEIIENNDNSGLRAFRTQGVENTSPDNFITYEGNVIGRVTWHIPYAGKILTTISENFLLFIAAVFIICILVSLLRLVFADN